MTRDELNTICTQIQANKKKSAILDHVKSQIEAMRDAAILPTTKAIYDDILRLFDWTPGGNN